MRRIVLAAAAALGCGGTEFPPVESRYGLAAADGAVCTDATAEGWGPDATVPAEGFCYFDSVSLDGRDCETVLVVFSRVGSIWQVDEVHGEGCR
jgi:hypothetical protein